ncbi:MAG: lipid-binding SYLF domain-containing protein [Candidatus Aureabacteria bacterium]|nr:lipid-binding SYLF domain-containing protein [Candidatus Auribacterota bacterium]MCK5161209.1 lipid-binding SYLF domain-containing protein [Candidatus Auribacterota bacterium]
MKLLLSLFLIFSLSTACFSADPEGRVNKKLENCATVIQELLDMPEDGIPADLLDQCTGIAIFPNTIKGGFILGGRGGTGVVLSHDKETGEWSAPAFVGIGGISFGFQIGAQASDIVLVTTSRKGLDMLLRHNVTLGVDAAVAAGPVGRNAEISTDILLQTPILSYSRTKGAFIGVALDGAVIAQDKKDNKTLYGKPLTAIEIVIDKKVSPTPEGKKLINALN